VVAEAEAIAGASAEAVAETELVGDAIPGMREEPVASEPGLRAEPITTEAAAVEVPEVVEPKRSTKQ
jgi:hypothetical protein